MLRIIDSKDHAQLVPMFTKILVVVDRLDPSFHALEVTPEISEQNEAKLSILTI